MLSDELDRAVPSAVLSCGGRYDAAERDRLMPFTNGWEQRGPLRWDRNGWVVYPDSNAWAAQIGDVNPTNTYRVFLTRREAFEYANDKIAEAQGIVGAEPEAELWREPCDNCGRAFNDPDCTCVQMPDGSWFTGQQKGHD